MLSLNKMIRVKKCETTGFVPGKSRPGFLYATFSGVPTPLFSGSTSTRVGGSGVLPRKFFHLRWLNPLKFNSEAARLMLYYANKTKGTITLKHGVIHKHHTFILGGDKVNKGCYVPAAHNTPLVNVMTFIFIAAVGETGLGCSLH